MGEKESVINQFLECFDVDFRLCHMRANADLRRNQKIVYFTLCHKNNTEKEVAINSTSNTPSFKTFLSEGDKNVLAFSLFMSNLMSQKKLEKSIVIFDDPVSSFDIERCNTFGYILKKQLIDKVSQLIISSHDKIFLSKLMGHIPIGQDLSVIEILKNPQNRDSSIIACSNFNKVCSLDPEHKGYIETLIKTRQENVPVQSIREALRKLSEFFIKFKFVYFLKNPEQPLGGLISDLKKDPELDENMKDVLPLLEDINDATKGGMHVTAGKKMISTQNEAVVYINQILTLFGVTSSNQR